MTDREQNTRPAPEPEDHGDDLENLTSDERAAFEKIMSQIGDAEGDPGLNAPPPSAADASKPAAGTDGTSPESDKAQEAPKAESTPPSGTGEDLTDDQQAALDNIMSEIKGGDDDDADEGPAEAAGASGDGEDLTDEQQAALDNIMSEIKGGDDDDADESPAEAAEATGDGEDLTDEQQAALDNIMSEIKGGDDDDADEGPAEAAGASGDGEDLTDDQQAALDNIMAEIKGDDDDDADEGPAEAAGASGDGEDLSDEQQAALDNIMAEIKGGDDDDADEGPAEAAGASGDGEDLSDEQQAALDNIMSEIKDAKAETPDDEPVEAAPPPAPEASVDTSKPEGPPEPAKEELSLDEFNRELNSLLEVPTTADETPDQADATPTPKEGGSAPEPKPDPSAEGQGYAMLKEVDAGDSDNRVKHPGKQRRQRRRALLPARRAVAWCAAVLSLVLVSAGGYWGYGRWSARSMPDAAPLSAPAPVAAEPAATPTVRIDGAVPMAVVPPEAAEASPAAVVEDPPPSQDLSPFALLASDLAAARQRLHEKIEEIKELKTYYRKGIIEEQGKIEGRIPGLSAPTLKMAMSDSRIELSLQAIQRRETYIAKLDVPLKYLADLSEKLLFLERRNRMYELLDTGLSGLPIARLKHDVAEAIADQKEKSKQLSIDHVKVEAPTLAAIWKEIRQHTDTPGSGKPSKDDVTGLNRKISREMCGGDFDRKYLLTAISVESANCLSKWQGKDLYLNNLTTLPPGVAKALSHWPGEWLSLNGVKSISSESAKYLSQWPGRRLSLNGLTHLSSAATAHLSQWHGEQLEMVGLKSIGRWENYGTRLYLSESLKRKLKRP